MYTPKTRSDSTLVSCMPSTERSRVCFGEFAIFCLVKITLYLDFAGCIFIFIPRSLVLRSIVFENWSILCPVTWPLKMAARLRVTLFLLCKSSCSGLMLISRQAKTRSPPALLHS